MTIEEYNKSVTQYADRLYRFVAKNVKDLHFAEDIVQDSYEKLWKNVSQVNGEKVKTYLFTTAYHTLIDRVRKEKRMFYAETLPDRAESFASPGYDVTERVNEAVGKLPKYSESSSPSAIMKGTRTRRSGKSRASGITGESLHLPGEAFLKNYIGKIDVLI